MPSEIHALDGGAVSAPAPSTNAAYAQVAHQEPPPEAAAAHSDSSAAPEQGKGQRVDTAA